MANALTYDLMLETAGILRSEEIQTELNRELEAGETITLLGRRWLVTDVAMGLGGRPDRRAIAREIVDEGRS
jgi:hypothetical protein